MILFRFSFQIYILPPYRTPRPFWYSRNFPEVVSTFTRVPLDLLDRRVQLLPDHKLDVHHFNPDGVIPEAMIRTQVMRQITDFITSETPSVFLSEPFETDGDFAELQLPFLEMSNQISRIDQTQRALISDVSSLRAISNITSARQAEEHDGRLNETFEARIVIHGIATVVNTNDRDARTTQILNAVRAAIDRVFSGGHRYVVVSGQYFGGHRPIYEATLESVQMARELRQEFGRLSIAQRRATGLRILNSITAGSRVRLAILRVGLNYV